MKIPSTLSLSILACALAATLPKTNPQSNNLVTQDEVLICTSYSQEYASFIVMEKAIQDLTKKLMSKTNELEDSNFQENWTHSFQKCRTASNSSANSSKSTVVTDDCSDWSKVVAITMRLADTMTRSPERCKDWLESDKVAQDELFRAATLTERAQEFLPSDNEFTTDLNEIQLSFTGTYLKLSMKSTSSGIKASDHVKKISDCVSNVKSMLLIIHSIDFTEYSYDKLLSFAQFLIDVSRFAGLDEKVLEEELNFRKIVKEMEFMKIDKDNVGKYSNSSQLQKTNEVKVIHDDISQRQETGNSSMSPNASDSSNYTNKCNENDMPYCNDSRLQSVETVHQGAADITKAFIYSLSYLPKRCEEWFLGEAEAALSQLQSVAWKAYDAKLLLPSDNWASQTIEEIRASLLDIYHDIKAMENISPKDFSNQSEKCVSLVKEMFGILAIIDYMELPFHALLRFSKFLISFVRFFNSHANDKGVNLYEQRMQEIILCHAKLDLKDKN